MGARLTKQKLRDFINRSISYWGGPLCCCLWKEKQIFFYHILFEKMSNRMLSLCSAFGRREMLRNRVCNNTETDEKFPYSQWFSWKLQSLRKANGLVFRFNVRIWRSSNMFMAIKVDKCIGRLLLNCYLWGFSLSKSWENLKNKLFYFYLFFYFFLDLGFM